MTLQDMVGISPLRGNSHRPITESMPDDTILVNGAELRQVEAIHYCNLLLAMAKIIATREQNRIKAFEEVLASCGNLEDTMSFVNSL